MAGERNNNSGALFRNEHKKPDTNQPDYKGKATIEGVEYKIAAWVKTKDNRSYFSFQFTRADEDGGGRSGGGSSYSGNSDVPF